MLAMHRANELRGSALVDSGGRDVERCLALAAQNLDRIRAAIARLRNADDRYALLEHFEQMTTESRAIVLEPHVAVDQDHRDLCARTRELDQLHEKWQLAFLEFARLVVARAHREVFREHERGSLIRRTPEAHGCATGPRGAITDVERDVHATQCTSRRDVVALLRYGDQQGRPRRRTSS